MGKIVEVIRCEDCKNWKRIYGDQSICGECQSSEMWESLNGETSEVNYIGTYNDHYCGYAERKINE